MRFLIIGIVLTFISCDTQTSKRTSVEYRNGRQLLSLNDKDLDGDTLARPEIGLIIPDSIQLGEQFSARIFLKTKDYRLIDAYKDLNLTDTSTVDTTIVTSKYYKPFKGGMRLLVQNDTLGIYFRPGKVGQLTFSDITLLTLDKNKVFRTIPYSFEYNVYSK